MKRFLAGPWLPTAAFAALSLFDVVWARGLDTVQRFTPVVTALIVVPLAWHAFVLRPGRPRLLRRAMLAGATSGLLTSISMPFLASTLDNPHQQHAAGTWASTGTLGTILAFWGATLFAAPVGALVGALVELVRKRWSQSAAAAPAPPVPNQDGTLGGAMVAILAGPVLSILGVALLPLPLRIVTSQMNPASRLFMTWLVLIPFGAWAGARAVASRRTLPGRRSVA